MIHVVIDLLDNFDMLVAQVDTLRLRASTTERSRDGALWNVQTSTLRENRTSISIHKYRNGVVNVAQIQSTTENCHVSRERPFGLSASSLGYHSHNAVAIPFREAYVA